MLGEHGIHQVAKPDRTKLHVVVRSLCKKSLNVSRHLIRMVKNLHCCCGELLGCERNLPRHEPSSESRSLVEAVGQFRAGKIKVLDPPLLAGPGQLISVGVGVKLNDASWVNLKAVFDDLVQQLPARRIFFQAFVIGRLEYDNHSGAADGQSRGGERTAEPQFKHKCSVGLCKAIHDVGVEVALRCVCIDGSADLAFPAFRFQFGITGHRF